MLPSEVAAVGNEGFVGAAAYLGAARSPAAVVAEIAGEVSQSTACNDLHSVGQRLCRWLHHA